MSVVKNPRPSRNSGAQSRKLRAADPAAAQLKAARAAAKAKAAEEKKAKAAEKAARAAAVKAAKAKAAEEKKAKAAEKAAAVRAAKAKVAEEKKAKAAEKAANPVLRARRPLPKRKPTDVSPESLTLDAIERMIREAYLGETRGAVKERVLLKDLRPKVGVQSQDFEQTLLLMQQQGKVVLMGLDNPTERTPEVEAAAIHIAGSPRYLVYFQG